MHTETQQPKSARSFALGDTVRLRSGGPEMTVVDAEPDEDGQIHVVYFDTSWKYDCYRAKIRHFLIVPEALEPGERQDQNRHLSNVAGRALDLLPKGEVRQELLAALNQLTRPPAF